MLTLHGLFCREAGEPGLRFGDAPGVSCGRSAQAGSATATRVAALVRQGKLFEALAGDAEQCPAEHEAVFEHPLRQTQE